LNVPEPILLILGPSGSGKTTLAEYLATDHGMLHINFDQPGDGVDVEGLRQEWNTFLIDRNPELLAAAIRGRIRASGSQGALITCPSGIYLCKPPNARLVELPQEYLSEMKLAGIDTIVLFGARDDCVASFLRREKETGRLIGDAAWWDTQNGWWYDRFSRFDFEKHVIQAFDDATHRLLIDLVAEIQSRIGEVSI
jgi:adenylate kinase family enzyme